MRLASLGQPLMVTDQRFQPGCNESRTPGLAVPAALPSVNQVMRVSVDMSSDGPVSRVRRERPGSFGMRRLGLGCGVVRPLAALLLGTQLVPLPLLAQGWMASPDVVSLAHGSGAAGAEPWVAQQYDANDKKEKKKQKHQSRESGPGHGQSPGGSGYRRGPYRPAQPSNQVQPGGYPLSPGQSNSNRYGQSQDHRKPNKDQQDKSKQERYKKHQYGQDPDARYPYKSGDQKQRQQQKERQRQKEQQRQLSKDRYRGHPERWKDWDSNRWRDYNKTKVNVWTKKVNVKYNFNGYPGWATSSRWYYSRPWSYGWYGSWSAPPWGWWTGQSLVWGVSSLATAMILNNAINTAISARQPTIIVPTTNWMLYYGSVQAVDDAIVEFTVYRDGYDGGGNYQMVADCSDGLLNGDVPSTSSEAQLVNAACQVAFGKGG